MSLKQVISVTSRPLDSAPCEYGPYAASAAKGRAEAMVTNPEAPLDAATFAVWHMGYRTGKMAEGMGVGCQP